MYLIFFLFLSLVYSSQQEDKDQIIYIHLVPHSHNDPGWIYTIKEYYEGYDPKYCVKCQLDTILPAMQANKNRTYSWSETLFLKLWYDQLSDDKKNIVKGLIKEKRLEIRGGSWVENDEANVHYQGIIDQIRFGLTWLKEEFNLQVKTASFLDSYGHSVSNAAILSKMGYENIISGRIDWREKEIRSKNKSLEFFWRPYYSYDKGKTNLFTLFLLEHYNPPKNSGLLDLIYNPFSGTPQIRANNLLEWALETKDSFLTNQRIIYYGDDFTFKNAELIYNNVELIMKEINSNTTLNSKIRLFYSTTDKYIDSILQSNSSFPYYDDNDFFPYSDSGISFWAGYFTSRPFLKGLIMDTGRYLSTFSRFYFEDLLDRKLGSKSNNRPVDDNQVLSRLMQLKEINCISQHHDAITGTSRERVSNEYINRLLNSLDQTNQSTKSILKDLLNNQMSTLINIENLIEICNINRKDCRKNVDKLNDDSLNLFVIFNPGLNDTLHLKLNVSLLNFEVFELNSEGEHKLKFDNICTYINDNINWKYCSAYIDINFKKDVLFTILKIKKVEKENVVKRKSLVKDYKVENEKTLREGNNENTDKERVEEINLLSIQKNKNIQPECYINITFLYSSDLFMINGRYFRTNDFVTLIISEGGSKNNFYLDLNYIKDCKDIKVVKVDDIHYFGFKEYIEVFIDNKLFFLTSSDLSNINRIEKDVEIIEYNYNNYTVYNDSIHEISFNLKDHFRIYNKLDDTNLTVKFQHCLISNDNSKDGMSSGVYIQSIPEPLNMIPLNYIVRDSFIFEGDTVKEIHLRTKLSTIKIRIFNSSSNMFEVESILDPNYLFTNFEFMLLIQTNLDNSVLLDNKNSTEFWTDSNSMKMVRRIKDHRLGYNITGFLNRTDNISSNFYPVNSIFSLKNNTDKIRSFEDSVSNYSFLNVNDSIVTIFTDRPQGFTSFNKGEILIDLTRFSYKDDERGLVRGFSEYQSRYSFSHLTHLISFNTLKTKSFIDQLQKKPFVFNLDLVTNSNVNKDQINEVYQELKKASSKRSIFEKMIVVDDCLELNISIISERIFILQFFNKNDYFFHKFDKGNLSFTEKFYEIFNVKETSLNGISFYEKSSGIKEVELVRSYYTIDPQDFKTFLIEFK